MTIPPVVLLRPPRLLILMIFGGEVVEKMKGRKLYGSLMGRGCDVSLLMWVVSWRWVDDVQPLGCLGVVDLDPVGGGGVNVNLLRITRVKRLASS